jgi:cellulose synthase/poly-beta-1,6-N-acetylglucosamine synthase-like glycosyltransferase
MSLSWLIWPILLADSSLRFFLLLLRAAIPDRVPPPPEPGGDWGAEGGVGCTILIAAHDEAGVIGPTVSSLKSLLPEWPGSALWVIADRSTDSTPVEAASAGVQVARRTEGPGSKAGALAWWMETHRNDWESRAAVLVLDADSRLEPGSLAALSGSLDRYSDAAQCFVTPEATTRQGRLAGWSELLMQRIDDEARRRLDWSVPLRGTGMLFRPQVLAEFAPKLHTLTEDLELDILIASRGRRVTFVPRAVVTDPKPRESSGASRQRARWFQGQLQVMRDYSGEIVRALTRGGLSSWMLIPLLLLRPKVLFVFLRLLAAALGWWRPAAAGLALDLFYYLGGAFFVENRRRYLRDLVSTPRYAAMWLLSLSTAAVRRGWLRAGR